MAYIEIDEPTILALQKKVEDGAYTGLAAAQLFSVLQLPELLMSELIDALCAAAYEGDPSAKDPNSEYSESLNAATITEAGIAAIRAYKFAKGVKENRSDFDQRMFYIINKVNCWTNCLLGVNLDDALVSVFEEELIEYLENNSDALDAGLHDCYNDYVTKVTANTR